METFLSGDVGGTNTRLQLFQLSVDSPSLKGGVESGKIAPGLLLCQEQYQNCNYAAFNDILGAFLKLSKVENPPLTACLAIAGPVQDNQVSLTNRDWLIDGESIEKSFAIRRVLLINDFLGQGYGLLTLDEDSECVALQGAKKVRGGPIACIGAGTGLGECFLTSHVVHAPGGKKEEHEYQCFPSEGGHAEFSPRNDLEYGLLKHLKKKHKNEGSQNRISMERVVAGSGIPDVYEYLCIKHPEQIDHNIHRKISSAGDLKAAVIAQHKGLNELCRMAMDIFLTHYGSEAGTACLKWVPTGGLYITGGNTPKNIDEIKDPDGLFLKALHDKGRVRGIIKSCPIYAVTVTDLGERGAHYVAFKELQKVLKILDDEKNVVDEIIANDKGSSSEASNSLSSLPIFASIDATIPLVIAATAIATTAIMAFQKK
jgi:glucokinase